MQKAMAGADSNNHATTSHYAFNEQGKLLDADGNPFKFTNQKDYDQLGARLTEEMHEMMQKPPYSLRKMNLLNPDQVEITKVFCC